MPTRLVETAQRKIEREQVALSRIQKEVADFKNRLLVLYKQHLELISSLPADEEEAKAAPAPEEEAPAPAPAQEPGGRIGRLLRRGIPAELPGRRGRGGAAGGGGAPPPGSPSTAI